MAKKHKRKDPNQLDLDFKFNSAEQVEQICRLKEEILSSPITAQKSSVSWEEDCIELAAAAKRAVRQSGMSREETVDKINNLYGWISVDDLKEKQGGKKKHAQKHLSYPMFSHHLSKPAEYPLPGYLLYAIQRVTESLQLAGALAEDMGGDTISKEEKTDLALGKLELSISEMQKLKRELKGRG
ncbi:MAG: hypothetical protein JRE47_12060 [Deltaproteobacteria bacterium]|nr:hypothetical protein [Deltaproteobacteria bacterium]